MQGKHLIDWFLDYAYQLDLARVPSVGRHPVWLTREQCRSVGTYDMLVGIPIKIYPDYPIEKKQNFCKNCGEHL